jgi:hypothetical protein
MLHAGWYSYLLVTSLLSAGAGLGLLLTGERPPETDEHRVTEENFLRMTFVYWMVYTVAVLSQKLITPDWEALMLGLKLTAVLTYCLTFSCILCLPLHHFEARRQTQ